MNRFIFLILTFFYISNIFAIDKEPKVIVIGAGLAGLTTAYRLLDNDIDVELYEARSRVGGRIFSVKINENIAELGGQNIGDGDEAENIHQLLEELDLNTTRTLININRSFFNGKELISEADLLKKKNFDPATLKAKLQSLAKNAHNMAEILQQIVDREDPLYDDIAVRMAAYEGGSVENLSPIYIGTLYRMLVGWNDSAEPKGHMEFETIKGGNSLLPIKLAEELGPRVHLNKVLTKVSKREDGTFLITFEDGNKITADILVLAIPCSVFENITFGQGVIPSKRLADIMSIRYGENAKICVPFECIPKTNSALTSKDVICFVNVPNDQFTIYYTGQSSFFSKRSILNAYLLARPMIELGFGKECPPVEPPLFADQLIGKNYSGPVGYSWPNDPFVKGSYAYVSPGQEKLLTSLTKVEDEKYRTLFQPLNGLYFAGEHTTILLNIPGTMEAACESGERIARAILHLTDG